MLKGSQWNDEDLLKIINQRKIHLIEDVCESHGAKFKGKKIRNFWSNF